MIVRALDSDGDWTYGKGKNNYLTDLNAVVQNINSRVKSFLGDCFFDLGAGIDWFHLIGSKNQTTLNLSIAAVILNTEDVTGILLLNVDLDHETRSFSVSYKVQTSYSTTITNSFIYDLNGVS